MLSDYNGLYRYFSTGRTRCGLSLLLHAEACFHPLRRHKRFMVTPLLLSRAWGNDS